jgi:glutamate synthase (NADPH/NADH) small chain
MGKPTGFLEISARKPELRPVHERRQDYREVTLPAQPAVVQQQASRCMDCGIAFCHQGCPLGNLIPEWNDQVYHGADAAAWARLQATNNFPEWTGRLCPAPCEASCVLALQDLPVTIKAVELSIIERAFNAGWVQPRPPEARTGKRVAVVGSGPAGLAAAAQLNQAGHAVTVFERADRIGGLLRYGIPDFKMEKRFVDRRLDIMAREGVEFITRSEVGPDIPLARLQAGYDAILLAIGAGLPRDLQVPGRQLRGVHWAMDFLTLQNRRVAGDPVDAEAVTARGKRVIIIGGGDTGADCLGTAHRQGARAVSQFELHPRPPRSRAADNPWPQWPRIVRVSPAHQEGGEQMFSVNTVALQGDAQGHVRALHAERLAPDVGPDLHQECDLVVLAMGFVGPESTGVLSELQFQRTERGTVWHDARWMTNQPKVFTAGDMQRGQSLVVWAIADGRNAAHAMDDYLMGRTESAR